MSRAGSTPRSSSAATRCAQLVRVDAGLPALRGDRAHDGELAATEPAAAPSSATARAIAPDVDRVPPAHQRLDRRAARGVHLASRRDPQPDRERRGARAAVGRAVLGVGGDARAVAAAPSRHGSRGRHPLLAAQRARSAPGEPARVPRPAAPVARAPLRAPAGRCRRRPTSPTSSASIASAPRTARGARPRARARRAPRRRDGATRDRGVVRRAFAASGLDPRAMRPCYGLAEATLAVTFDCAGEGVRTAPVPDERRRRG